MCGGNCGCKKTFVVKTPCVKLCCEKKKHCEEKHEKNHCEDRCNERHKDRCHEKHEDRCHERHEDRCHERRERHEDDCHRVMKCCMLFNDFIDFRNEWKENVDAALNSELVGNSKAKYVYQYHLDLIDDDDEEEFHHRRH